MPVFHEYSESYHKSGYYVKVNWSAGHPHPLQTPSITAQIYLELGYEPGDDVPNELTSRLYHAGLHWTEGQGPGKPSDRGAPDSIADSSLPALDSEQLEALESLLNRSLDSASYEDVDRDSLNTLKSQLRELENSAGGSNAPPETSGNASDAVVSALEDLWGRDVSKSKATAVQNEATNSGSFDRTVTQFTKEHLVTPRDFEVNSHGTPTFYFHSGAVRWSLADCRGAGLSFDWAITIGVDTERQFGLRFDRKGAVRIVSDENTLTRQQATNLITVLPCVAWTIDELPDYSLRKDWNCNEATSALPDPHEEWLQEQTAAAREALITDDVPTEGTIIDLPNRQFGRIRTQSRHIVYTPVHGLPDTAKLGSEVNFDLTSRYAQHCATDVELVNPSTENREVSFEGQPPVQNVTVEVPDPAPDRLDDDESRVVLRVWEVVSAAESIKSDLFRDFALSIPRTDETLLEEAYETLLFHTPFDPKRFPEIASELNSNHRLNEYDITVEPIALAYCVAAFYERLNVEKAVEEADGQGDTTVLYRQNDRVLLLGSELLSIPVASGLDAVPRPAINSAIENLDAGWTEFDLRVFSALSEREFHRTMGSGHSYASKVIKEGLKNADWGLNVLLLDDPEAEDNSLGELIE